MFKRFISYYKAHLPLFILDMSAAIVVALTGLFYPTIARRIINDYAPSGKLNAMIYAALMLLLLYLLKAVCNYIIGHLGHVVGVRIQADMRRDLFKKYESLPFSYFDSHKTGDLLSRLVSDLLDVAELAHHAPENLLLAVLMLIGSFVVLSDICLPLTLIMFAVIPFIVLFTALSRRKMRRAMNASRRQIAEINSHAENAISGIRETKSYVTEQHELARFDEGNRAFAHYRSGAMKYLGIFDAMMNFFSDFLYLLVIFIGGVFLYQGRINAGDFTAFVLYITLFLDPIKRLTTLFEQLQEGMSGFSRFHEIMCLENESDTGTKILSDVKGEIVFDKVTFGYDNTDEERRDVLSDLSLEIGAGEILALVGPSGGGKSTLCHLIPRFYSIQSGAIRIDGTDVREYTLSSLRENIGIVSQNVFLFNGTVRENILYGKLDATEDEMIYAAKKAKIHDFVMELEHGYDTVVGERGVRLSGGQKQRVAIARLFLKNPKLLILDEATSALDNATEMQIQSSLEELSRGRTVIVVAHRLSTVKRATKIIVLDKNGIAESGTHEELIEKGGIYRELYDYQFRTEA